MSIFYKRKTKYYLRDCDFCGIMYTGQGAKFCGYSCSRKASPIIMRGDENPSKRPNVRQKISDAKKGIGPSQNTIDACVKAHKGFYGKDAKNGRWREGIDRSRNQEYRGRTDWKIWRTSVFARDGYKCIDCGIGGDLQPHHINPIRVCREEEIFDVNNGITLCRECHQHTFGKELDLISIYKSFIPVVR